MFYLTVNEEWHLHHLSCLGCFRIFGHISISFYLFIYSVFFNICVRILVNISKFFGLNKQPKCFGRKVFILHPSKVTENGNKLPVHCMRIAHVRPKWRMKIAYEKPRTGILDYFSALRYKNRLFFAIFGWRLKYGLQLFAIYDGLNV